MVENDVQLIHRILSGDEQAFSTLVRKYQKSVHALAWRKIGDFHIAEEIAQDAFLQAYKNLATLRNPNQFAGWLYVIANNLCKRWHQKQKLSTRSLEGTPMTEIENSSYKRYESEQREVEAAERRHEIVKELLETLPESERTVVTLHYLGEMTAQEISKFLGVSVNTIKSRIRRARERLQPDDSPNDHEKVSKSTDRTREPIESPSAFAVSGETFYVAYKRRLFRWRRGESEWFNRTERDVSCYDQIGLIHFPGRCGFLTAPIAS